MKFKNVNQMYKHYVNVILKNGKQVGNTKELTNVIFTVKDVINNNIINIRGISYKYVLAELIWYFSGSNSTEFIGQFGDMWNKISDDGVTNNSAYGFILKEKYDFDQIEKIIELLKKDSNSRRAVLNINSANKNVIETKDEPCTISIQFILRNGYLNMTTVMRSNDLYFGLPYDAIFFTELQKYIACRLNCDIGWWTHFVGSMHIYERDIKKLSNLKNDDVSYKVNITKLIENVDYLYKTVNKDNIIEKCKNLGVLYDSLPRSND